MLKSMTKNSCCYCSRMNSIVTIHKMNSARIVEIGLFCGVLGRFVGRTGGTSCKLRIKMGRTLEFVKRRDLITS